MSTLRTLLQRLEEAFVAGHYNRADDTVVWPAETYRRLNDHFSALREAVLASAVSPIPEGGPLRWTCKKCGKARRRSECLSCGDRSPLTDEARTSGIIR